MTAIIFPSWIYQISVLIISGAIWSRRRDRDSKYTGYFLIAGAVFLSLFPWSILLAFPFWLLLAALGYPSAAFMPTMEVFYALWVTSPFVIDEIRRITNQKII